MKRTNSRVQSLSDPEPNTEAQLPRGSLIPADRLSRLLDVAMASQKTDLKLAVSAVARGSCTNSDLRYVDCYVDGTALLLDACVSIQDRLASLRHSLRSVRIALHYLEGEHEPSGAAVRRAVEALESGDFADGGKPEKYVSKLKAVWKRLNEHAMEYKENDDSISPELYKALSGSWTMAVLGIGVLCSATSCRPPVRSIQSQKSDKWGTVVNELSRKTSKMHIKKTDDVATMEELAGASLAAQAILKLVSTSQMLGSNGAMKRVAVKAISGDLQCMGEKLEKVLSTLEEKTGELYGLIVSLRMSLIELLSKAEKDKVVLELVKEVNLAQADKADAWVMKPKSARRSFSLAKIGPHFLRFRNGTSIKPYSATTVL